MSRQQKDGISRRRTIAGLTTGVVFGLAGCSGGESTATEDGGGSTPKGDSGSTGGSETTTGGEMGAMATEMDTSSGSGGSGGKNLTLSVGGLNITSYDSLVVSIDSLTFRTGDNRTNPTFDIGATVDLTKATKQNPKTVAEGIVVPYGTYEEVALSVTVQNQSDISGGTLTSSLAAIGDEPIQVEQSQFDATLDLYITVLFNGLDIDGFRARGL